MKAAYMHQIASNYMAGYQPMIKRRNIFRILIVDDDIDIASLLKDYLEQRGHNVTTIDDGSRGITKSIFENYDIVFLDYHLSNIESFDGVTVGECIIEHKRNNNMIIFAYTGDNSKEAIKRFRNSGMDGVIFKPIDIDALNKLMNILEINNHIDKMAINKITRSAANSMMLFD